MPLVSDFFSRNPSRILSRRKTNEVHITTATGTLAKTIFSDELEWKALYQNAFAKTEMVSMASICNGPENEADIVQE